MLRRLFIVLAACVLVLSLAGCGFDSLESTLTWSSGDLDLVIREPNGVDYIAYDGLLTPSGFFDGDFINGGSETFRTYPLIHASGDYYIGIANNEYYDVNFSISITRNGENDVLSSVCPARTILWVDPPFNIRQPNAYQFPVKNAIQ